MARTVSGNTITQALIDKQNSSGRVPFIGVKIDDVEGAGAVEYWSRVEYIEYHEEAYRDRAVIGLNNRDNALDNLDLDGQEFDIATGYITGNAVAEPLGNDDTAEYVHHATLWVKSHQIISLQGERIYQIYAEGMWMRLREQKVLAGANIWKASSAYVLNQTIGATTPNGHSYKCTTAGTSGASEPTWPTSSGGTVTDGSVAWTETGAATPYSNVFNATHTVYGLIELIIEGALGWTLTGSPPDDSIMDTFSPVFSINEMGYENAAAILYRLIWMTKEFLRPRTSKTFQCVYPQTTDAVDETYYSDKAHWFTDYVEKSILLIPNSIVVLCNQDPSGEWNTDAYPLIVGTASDAAQIAKYAEIIQVFVAGSITTQADADLRAAAILSKLKSEILGGKLVIPHDARVELYDKVATQDNRT